jgi:plasmid stabilization system protein ParE
VALDVVWSPEALDDLDRLYSFLAEVNRRAAAERARDVVAYVDYIAEGRYGLTSPLRQFEPHDVRRGGVSQCEVRFLFDLPANTLTVIRIFHEREDR